MSKKIFALVMVISVFGAFLAGCSKKEDDAAGATAGTATAGAATAGTATAGTTGDTKTP
ncbi:hypothetical protein [Fimbriimonas ginsengisoli]|uniref:Lipoprotein n=1 Tax=Fimbriimonas ginsengisoli Gsoil 348 TaxID=661478 RepID=A0A068NN63_FIMGI|nr:hypothetical protein [Fimbriimonas ginsengisoli]AIE84901.1 hypothetical protein OP10G_1533 [Fimbriimonas ginsengisoli Gsoil 348]